MTKGWHGDKQRHSMSAKGIKSGGVWFESNGVLTEVITLFSKEMSAKGFDRDEYTGDASRVVLMPSSRVEDSIEWLQHEYETTTSPQRKIHLERLIKMTLNRIRLELRKENPQYIDNELKQSYKMYKNLLGGIETEFVSHGVDFSGRPTYRFHNLSPSVQKIVLRNYSIEEIEVNDLEGVEYGGDSGTEIY